MAQSLSTEKFWGVAAETAKALGEVGGDKARDTLLTCLTHQHPKVRAACADQLGAFPRDSKVATALRSLIEHSDPSYRVEAAAIRSLGKVKPDHAGDFIVSLLNRDSHQERIRSAALMALGELGEPSRLDLLIEWTEVGHPRWCRSAALRGLRTLADNTALSDQQTRRIVDAASAAIPGDNPRVQGPAIRTLSALGQSARPALDTLRDTQAHDPERRVQMAAKQAIEKITSESAPQVQVTELREQLDTLQADYTAVKHRLDELEAVKQ